MLNCKRIKELQVFADDFNNEINLAGKRYEDTRLLTLQKEKEKEKSISELSVSRKTSPKRRKQKYSSELFKETPSWKPTDGYGHYFGDFKLPILEHPLDPWEIVNTHQYNTPLSNIKRSYEKQENMVEGKNFVCREQTGKEFEYYSRNTPITASLSSAGSRIIGSFIKENEKIEQQMRDKEKELYHYRHSKPKMDINPWKNSNHIITEFSILPGSKVESYKKEQRKKYFITSPYRIPKKEGDFFDKDFKRLY